jgi:hypothetical protein
MEGVIAGVLLELVSDFVELTDFDLDFDRRWLMAGITARGYLSPGL